jgi:hypothetical protein
VSFLEDPDLGDEPVAEAEQLDHVDRRRAARCPGRPCLRGHLHHGLAAAEYPGGADRPLPETPEDRAHRGYAVVTAVPAAVRSDAGCLMRMS